MTQNTFEASGLSLLAAAAWGGGDFSGGLAAKRGSVFRVVAIAHACGLLASLAMALASREAIPPMQSLAWGGLAGFVGVFGIVALYRALAIGLMGVVAPVAAVVTGVLPVVVALVREGMPAAVQLIGFAIALFSIWLIARPSEHVDSHRGVGLAAFAGVMFGLFLIAGKQAGHDAVFWPLVAARAVSTALMLVIVAVAPRDSRPLRDSFWPAALSGSFDAVGNALFIAATRHGRLDVAAVLSSLYPASTVILARIYLKEHIGKLQAFGIACALLSVALIAMH